jgi:hypothetical protein
MQGMFDFPVTTRMDPVDVTARDKSIEFLQDDPELLSLPEHTYDIAKVY